MFTTCQFTSHPKFLLHIDYVAGSQIHRTVIVTSSMLAAAAELNGQKLRLVPKRCYHGRKLLGGTQWMILFHAPIISPHVRGDRIGHAICMIASCM